MSVPFPQEACLIIGANEYGTQTRSHGTLRTINPLEDNHTWGEVLVSVIKDLKIPCQVGGKSEEEFESVICEHVTEQEWKSRDERERREIEKFISQQPELIGGLKVAGLNANKRRWVVNLMFQAAKRGGSSTYISAVKVAGRMGRTKTFCRTEVPLTRSSTSVYAGLPKIICIYHDGARQKFRWTLNRSDTWCSLWNQRKHASPEERSLNAPNLERAWENVQSFGKIIKQSLGLFIWRTMSKLKNDKDTPLL